jgi:small subunit ribosomal protein S4e
MTHLKRYKVPKYWKIPRKRKKFVVVPSPGPHPKDRCIPLLVLIRDILKYAETSKEAKGIIKSGKVLVDKKERKDPGYPIGLMDIIEMPELKKAFRVTVNTKGLFLEEIKLEEANKKLCRIQNKTILKGGKIQLNLHDGTNIITDKGYKTSDSILIKLPERKILKHFKFEKGANSLVISGKNIGVQGKVKEIFDRKTMLESSRVVLQTKDGEIETVKDYVLVGEI